MFCFVFFWSGVGFPPGWLCGPAARLGVGGPGEGHGAGAPQRGGSAGTGPARRQSALNVHIPFFVSLSDYPPALNMLMSLASPSA